MKRLESSDACFWVSVCVIALLWLYLLVIGGSFLWWLWK